MPLNPSLKQELKEEIISKLKRKMEKYDFSKKSGNPFVDIIFGKYSNLKSFEEQKPPREPLHPLNF